MYREENQVLRGVYIDAVNYRYQYNELLGKYKLIEVFLIIQFLSNRLKLKSIKI